MSRILDSALTADRRADAVAADISQAAEHKRNVACAAMQARIGNLGRQHTLNEMERARAGIDDAGKPVQRPDFATLLADIRWEDEQERLRDLRAKHAESPADIQAARDEAADRRAELDGAI